MGLFDKIKNVLFEEETVEIPVISKEKIEKKVEEPKELKLEPEERISPKKEKKILREVDELELPKTKDLTKEIEVLERDVQSSKQTFEFPVFDESDFEAKTRNSTRVTTTLDLEPRGKAQSKRIDFGKFEKKIDKEKPSGFKPTPVISPVYGVMDQEKIEEQKTKSKDLLKRDSKPKRKIDVDEARNKAYGTLEDEISEKIVKEEDLEDTKPTKTIDELLMNSIDETITVGDVEEAVLENEIKIEPEEQEEYDEELEDEVEQDNKDLTATLDILNEIESELDGSKKSRTNRKQLEDDTLESDLFNLIDSMYENREDGE